ncbi:MAG TPA: hypothetical protein VFZ89_09140 [Solirubrobacteraceae bacterium]
MPYEPPPLGPPIGPLGKRARELIERSKQRHAEIDRHLAVARWAIEQQKLEARRRRRWFF